MNMHFRKLCLTLGLIAASAAIAGPASAGTHAKHAAKPQNSDAFYATTQSVPAATMSSGGGRYNSIEEYIRSVEGTP